MRRMLLIAGLVLAACNPSPTPSPSSAPTATPTEAPSASQSPVVTFSPTPAPTTSPSLSPAPSEAPSASPTASTSSAIAFAGQGTMTTPDFTLAGGTYDVTWAIRNGPCTIDATFEAADGAATGGGHLATDTSAKRTFEVVLGSGGYRLRVDDPGCAWTVTIAPR